jgi:uncharacterized protein YecT (DUF1311 family)
MGARRLSLISVGAAALVLAGCERLGDAKTEASSGANVAAALDVCAEGQTQFAQNLCANRDLAKLDSAVSEVLVAESANVSDAGVDMLVQNQNRWRGAQRVVCGILAPDAAPTLEQEQCLTARLRARAQEVRSAVQELGGYTFQRIEIVEAAPVAASLSAASGRDDRAIVRDIRFPRIDGPQTPEVRAFNDLAAQQPQYRLQDAINETVDYTIAYAGPDLISVRFIYNTDQLRAATTSSTLRAVNVVMGARRALTDTDVFVPQSGWQDFITDRAVREISRQFSDYPDFPPRRDVYETATKPHLWVITQRGLTLLFPPLSFGGSHVDGATEVTIPWADLRPYLNPNAPAPIAPVA